MGDGMNGPEVAGISFDGLAPPPLGIGIGAAFFKRIGVHALHAAVAGHAVVPFAQHAGDDRAHDLAAPGVEAHGVVELERHQIERTFRKYLFPMRASQHDVACGPGLQRAHVAALAGGRRGEVGPDFIERLPDFRQDRFVLQHQEKIAAKTQRQHKSGILFQRGADMAESGGAVIEIVRHRRIDVGGRCFARRRQRQTSAIRVHAHSLRSAHASLGSTPNPFSTRSGVAGNS